MARLAKYLSLCLVVILVLCSMIMVESATAQTIPKPSIPEFTLKVVSHPYDVAPETTIDPYTGKTVITQHGYHVENKTVEITIKNQPLPKLSDSNYLYYNVSYKGQYGTEWKYFGYSQYEPLITQSNSDYTIVNFENLPVEGQMDFRVQAQIGYYSEIFYPMQFMDTHFYTFIGEVSGWSNTQTITIPEINPTITPTDTPNPTGKAPTDNSITLPLTTLALIILVAVLVPSLALIILNRKRQRGKPNE